MVALGFGLLVGLVTATLSIVLTLYVGPFWFLATPFIVAMIGTAILFVAPWRWWLR